MDADKVFTYEGLKFAVLPPSLLSDKPTPLEYWHLIAMLIVFSVPFLFRIGASPLGDIREDNNYDTKEKSRRERQRNCFLKGFFLWFWWVMGTGAYFTTEIRFGWWMKFFIEFGLYSLPFVSIYHLVRSRGDGHPLKW